VLSIAGRRAAGHLPFPNALAFIDLGGEEIAARVDRNVVHPMELAGILISP
jgi:hypothetical protein